MSQEIGSIDNSVLVIPAFGKSPALSLEMSKTREGEKRLIEAKNVSPIMYSELEHVYGESWRELRTHLSTISYQLLLADKALEEAKSTFLIDKYPDLIKDRTKSQDSVDLRKAYMMRDSDYLAALDRINMLKALEAFTDGKLKVFERVSMHMRKKMDLIIKSGLSSQDLYVTSGRK